MSTKKIGILVGSLRKDSFNRKIAQALVDLATADLTFEFIPIGHLPLYNQDYDAGGSPESYPEFRESIKAMDAILFVTPEYNRSIPGVLKNAIDVASRPYGKSAWDGKPAAVISVSIGAVAGFGANHHLRQILTFLNMPTLQKPEMYIGNVAELLDDKGAVKDKKTVEFFVSFLQSYADWIKKF